MAPVKPERQGGAVCPRPAVERAIARFAAAVADLDLAVLPGEAAALRAVAAGALDRALRLLYWDDVLPAEATLRQVLAACGRGAGQLLPLEWGRQHFVHQFLTGEFVAALAAHLRGQRVLEVGAGRGDLARALRLAGVDVIATDDGSWLDGRHHWPAQAPARVIALDYRAALSRFQPASVLCAWMPLGEDWTPAMRACPSVREYLLIGEGPGGCTGTPASFLAPDPWARTRLDDVARCGFTRNADRGYRTAIYRFARP